MGVRSILAERTRKRLRFAVLRPRDQAKVREKLDQFRAAAPLDSEAFQATANELLGANDLSSEGGAILVGYVKPNGLRLFDRDGTPTGDVMQPGDVLDEIEDFDRACASGGYQLVKRGGDAATAV